MRPRALLVVSVALLLVWLALMAGGVMWFYARFESHITVREQPVRVRLPSGLPALAEMSSPLRLQLPQALKVNVPVKQSVSLELRDSVQARVQVKTVLPVSTDVPVDHEVLISTVARMHAPVFRWLPPLDVTVPVQLRLPVHLVVPVRAEVPLDLDVTVSGELRKSVNVPVDTVLALRPQVKGDIVARMQAQTAFRLFGPQEPVPMTIADARLRVPFDLTWFTRRAP
ncbi:MAG: hypothetical protein A3G29_02180 [Burkholderiales bacterium RIFCSPLOWO2_12_FULL_64_99]|nr:MAG: hypothetical protein A3E52_10140 [Burkholderiales bacterium RIFCSPHIGHO2_12_FULL_63_20]OGB64329.1 MAG: hypothetical protein A3G29_02180 [Burkholderiales bacterium RIFCSPLOWO2_12_FULL_64_99]